MMIAKRIAFIGAGNITRCMLSGLLKNGCSPENIVVSNRGLEKLNLLVKEFGVTAAATNSLAVESCDIVILAVKPQVVSVVCRETANAIQNKKPLIISLATATRVDDISSWIGVGHLPIIRTMTNLAISVGMGTTALYANTSVSAEQRNAAESIFNAIGSAFWVNLESDINVLSPLIGCSPAYLFLLIEAIQKAAIERGVPEYIAEKVALASICGAAQLAKTSNISVIELRKKVTTPNGATEASLRPLLAGNYFTLFGSAFKEAESRCNEIEEVLHQQQRDEQSTSTLLKKI